MVLYVQFHYIRWDVRNIAKISPKMAKKQSFFDFFRFSQKLSIRFGRNSLQLFYTILKSSTCNGIKILCLGCEKQRQNCPKMIKKRPFFDFFHFLQKLSIRSERNFLQSFYLIRVLYVQLHQHRMAGIWVTNQK